MQPCNLENDRHGLTQPEHEGKLLKAFQPEQLSEKRHSRRKSRKSNNIRRPRRFRTQDAKHTIFEPQAFYIVLRRPELAIYIEFNTKAESDIIRNVE